MLFRSDDIRPFRHDYLNWFWGSYTAVYLGVAVAAYDEVRKVVHARRPQGYAQSLAYHPDVRRHVAQMSADLEAARLSPTSPPGSATRRGRRPRRPRRSIARNTSSAKRSAGSRASALTLGGAHGIFKGSRLEQLFRDGALAPIQPPPADFCLWNMGIYELGLDPADVLPPMKPA